MPNITPTTILYSFLDWLEALAAPEPERDVDAYTPAVNDVIVTEDGRVALILEITPSPFWADPHEFAYVMGIKQDGWCVVDEPAYGPAYCVPLMGTATDFVALGDFRPAGVVREAAFWDAVIDCGLVDAFTSEAEYRNAKAANAVALTA